MKKRNHTLLIADDDPPPSQSETLRRLAALGLPVNPTWEAGFDIEAVGEDRHGLRNSIIGRIERHGGKVDVRSTPGTGTEIEISMPR